MPLMKRRRRFPGIAKGADNAKLRGFHAKQERTLQTHGCCPKCCDPVEYVRCYEPDCPTAAKVAA